MEDYKLKQDFEASIVGNDFRIGNCTGNGSAPEALLSWDDVERYAQLDPGNARLRGLTADTTGAGMWRLLWMPPSLPYYGARRPICQSDAFHQTSRIFIMAGGPQSCSVIAVL